MDYEARLYNPQYAGWPTMDPLAEKYCSWSPYAYVANNPMKFVDPTGMDTLNVNHEGVMDYRIGGDTDIVNVTNKKGKTSSRTYDKGTLQGGDQKYRDKEKKDPKYGYVKVDSEKNSKDIFEFIAGNVSVEIGNSTFGDGSNYITSSHQEWMESGIVYLIIDKDLFDTPLLKYDHKHPVDGIYPSGLVGGREGHEGKGDMGFLQGRIAHAISKIHPIPKMRIYVPRKGYRTFRINSTQRQFNNYLDSYWEK